MSFPENLQIGFLPAHLVERGTDCLVCYAVRTAEGKYDYRRISVKKYKRSLSAEQFSDYVNNLCREINLRLIGAPSSGSSAEDARRSTPLDEALRLFLNDKCRTLRPATMTCYSSFCSMFMRWVDDVCPDISVGSVGKFHAVRYLECYYRRGVSNTAYNNQVKMGRCVFSWLVQHCYSSENPFSLIKLKRAEKKRRGLIDKSVREMISGYLSGRGEWGMLLVCHLVYTSLIRPAEIAKIHLEDINIKGHYITISDDVAKTHHRRVAAISPEIERLLIEYMRIDLYPSHYFLFSSDMLPGRSGCGLALFRKKWMRLRAELGLPDTMQLYSFRDTGITDLLRSGVDPISVMHHADHHSLDITTRYADHVDAHLVDMMYNRSKGF